MKSSQKLYSETLELFSSIEMNRTELIKTSKYWKRSDSANSCLIRFGSAKEARKVLEFHCNIVVISTDFLISKLKRVTQIKTYSWDNAQVVLVGNKSDMQNDRVVTYERGRQFAEHLGLEFFETSAKENHNVKQVFERLVQMLFL